MIYESHEEMRRALTELIHSHRPYMDLQNDVVLKLMTGNEYIESAMKILASAEDTSDLRSVADLLANATKKTTLMRQAVIEMINFEESGVAPEDTTRVF
jgi:hypothetical protein